MDTKLAAALRQPRRWAWALAFFLLASQGAWASGGDDSMTARMMKLVLQLAVIVGAAKVAGHIAHHYLKIPEVLGELAAGILIGPYCLGSVIGLFHLPVGGGFPISTELYGVATLASILLLYLTGLETDLGLLMKYSVVGTLVGVGGVVCSFVLGAGAAVWLGQAAHFSDPSALFLGTISTATSVGITARILEEKQQLHSPEGVTILAGAVVDDVLGIVVLAVVVGFVRAKELGGELAWGQIGVIAGKAVGFWLVATALGLWLAKRIEAVLKFFGSAQTMATMSFGLALLAAGLAEMAGLAMIVGAYIVGLSLSRTDSAQELKTRLEPVYHTLISIFFCVMGMLVDLTSMGSSVLLFGLAFSVLAILAKIVGCAIPAYFMGFNRLGALRVGAGMVPRGEVALIVAGVALATNAMRPEMFGVAIMMTLLTTIGAPLIMIRLFDQRNGLKVSPVLGPEDVIGTISLSVPNPDTGDFLLRLILKVFQQEECFVRQLAPGEPIYRVRKEEVAITVSLQGGKLELQSRRADFDFARLVLLEALAMLSETFEGLRLEQLQQQMNAQFSD